MKLRSIKKYIAIIAAALVVAFSTLFPTVGAVAEEKAGTGVMNDLSSASFDPQEYPEKTVKELKAAGENLLQLIRIGEGVNDELYLYVYQPSDKEKEIEAVKVVIKQTADLEQTTANVYDLTLVSTEGVFDKYLVKDLKVLSSLSLRYYAITSLMRKYDKELDADISSSGGEINHVPEAVAQIWYARTTESGAREYAYTQDKVVTITDKYHGFIRYPDGFSLLNNPYTDSHFIAFTTNYKIDELYSAEVYYTALAYNYREYYDGDIKVLKEKDLNHPVKKIRAEETGSNSPNSWFSKKYKWNRIEKLVDFLTAEGPDMSGEAKESLGRIQENAGENGAFVLRFLETSYTRSIFTPPMGGGPSIEEYETTKVSNVSILKLTFRTEGIPYTMGAIDTMVTPDDIPDGGRDDALSLKELWENLKAAFNDLQKTLKGITVAIGAIFGLGIVVGIVFGIIKLVELIQNSINRRRGN